jgi:hypothetical protein
MRNLIIIAVLFSALSCRKNLLPAIDKPKSQELSNAFAGINPCIYFSPAQFYNPAFMVFACDIVRPINSFSHGSDIVWDILLYEDIDSMAFDSVTQVGNKLTIHYPKR